MKKISNWHIQTKSTFWRLILSYLMILVLPLSTIIITYYTSQDILEKEILRTGSITAEKAFTDFDAQLSKMLETAMQILSDGKVSALINNQSDSSDAYQSLKIKKLCSSLVTDEIADIFLYHRASDTIISAKNSRLQSHYYFSTYLDDAKIGYEEWYNRLNYRNSRDLDVYQEKGKQPTISLYQSFPLNSVKDPEITVGIVLQTEEARKLISLGKFQQGSTLMVFDKNGNPLLSSSTFNQQIVPPENFDESILYKSQTDQAEFLIRYYRSKSTQATYAYIIPTSIFWNKLFRLNWIVTIALSLCILGCLLLTVMLAKKNYKPFLDLLSLIGRKTSLEYDKVCETEVDFIATAFEKVLVERDDFHQRMALETLNLKDEFLFKTIQGMILNKEEIIKGCNRYGILTNGEFCVALFEINKENISITELRRLLDKNEKGLTLFTTQVGVNGFACIISCTQKENLFIEEFLRSFCSDYTLSCGVGSQKSLFDIHTSYIEALQSLAYRFVYGDGRLVHYQETAERVFQYHYHAISQGEQIFRQFIHGQNDSASVAFNEVYRRLLGQAPPTPEMLRCFCHDLIRMMDQMLSDLQAARLQKDNFILNRLIEADNFIEFQEVFLEALVLLQEHNNSQKGKNNTVTYVLSYLQSHYHDSNLNVNLLGNLVKISPSYLSKLFREDTGVSITEYLLGLRISKAKQLLLDTTDTLEEIAKATGFLDSSSFVRIFKKVEGVTPGSYRKLKS